MIGYRFVSIGQSEAVRFRKDAFGGAARGLCLLSWAFRLPAAVLVLALPWAANSAENLIRNGNFESGKLGGWGTHPKEKIRIAPNGQGGSKHCLAFEAKSHCSQSIDLGDIAKHVNAVRFTMWVKCEGAEPRAAFFNVAWVDNKGKWLEPWHKANGTYSHLVTGGTHDWKRLEMVIYKDKISRFGPRPADRYCKRLALYPRRGGEKGTVYIDNVSLVPAHAVFGRLVDKRSLLPLDVGTDTLSVAACRSSLGASDFVATLRYDGRERKLAASRIDRDGQVDTVVWDDVMFAKTGLRVGDVVEIGIKAKEPVFTGCSVAEGVSCVVKDMDHIDVAEPLPLQPRVRGICGVRNGILVDLGDSLPRAGIAALRVYVHERPFNNVRSMSPTMTVPPTARRIQVQLPEAGKPFFMAVTAVNESGFERLDVEPLRVSACGRRNDTVVWADAFPPGARVLLLGETEVVSKPIVAAPGAFQWGKLEYTPGGADVVVDVVDPAGRVLKSNVKSGTSLAGVKAPAICLRATAAKEPVEFWRVECATTQKTRGILSGVALGSGGAPVVGARVMLAGGAGPLSVETAADGRYSFAQVPAGDYELRAARKGYLLSSSVAVHVGAEPVIANLLLHAPADKGYVLWRPHPLRKIFKDEQPAKKRVGGKLVLRAARNEYEPGQLAITAQRGVRNLTVGVSPLRHESGTHELPAALHAWNFVGYVPVKKKTQNTPVEELVRVAPGLFPDPLLERRECDVLPGETQPIWLTYRIPEDALPGRYVGHVTVTSEFGSEEMPVELHVYPFALPKRQNIFMTNWYNLRTLARFHSVEYRSSEFWEVFRKYAQNMREHGQNVGSVSIGDVRITYEGPVTPGGEGGSLSFDYTRFDEMAQFLIDNGIGERLEGSGFTRRQAGFSSNFLLRDRVVYRKDGSRVKGLATEIVLSALFRDLQQHLEEKGWLDRYMQHVGDEPIQRNLESWKACSAVVGKAAPKIRRVEAIEAPDFGDSLEVWVPKTCHLHNWMDTYKKRQSEGAELWFYVCLFPNQTYANRLIDYSLLKVRMLQWQNWLFDAHGFLHWGLNHWTDKPYESVERGSLPPGDAFVIYPGKDGPVNSLRWEITREGIEDFEYLHLHAEVQARLAKQLGAREFDPSHRGKQLLRAMCRSLIDFTKDPDDLLRVREQVAQEIMTAEQSPRIVFQCEPMPYTTMEPGRVRIRGAVERRTQVTINGRRVRTSRGRFDTVVHLTPVSQDVRVEVFSGTGTKTFEVSYNVKDTAAERFQTAVEDAASAGLNTAEWETLLRGYQALLTAADTPEEDVATGRDRIVRAIAKVQEARLDHAMTTAGLGDGARTAWERELVGELAVLRQKGLNQVVLDAVAALPELRACASRHDDGPCRITPCLYRGRPGLRLTNGKIEVVVWQDGARIIELSSAGIHFLKQGEFEDGDDLSKVDIGGYEDAARGKSATSRKPWRLTARVNTHQKIELVCEEPKWRDIVLTRTLALAAGSDHLVITYRFVNASAKPVAFTWRAHVEPAVGGEAQNDEFLVPTETVLPHARYDAGGAAAMDMDQRVRISQPYVGAWDPGVKAAFLHVLDKAIPEVYLWAGSSGIYTQEPWLNANLPPKGELTITNRLVLLTRVPSLSEAEEEARRLAQ